MEQKYGLERRKIRRGRNEGMREEGRIGRKAGEKGREDRKMDG